MVNVPRCNSRYSSPTQVSIFDSYFDKRLKKFLDIILTGSIDSIEDNDVYDMAFNIRERIEQGLVDKFRFYLITNGVNTGTKKTIANLEVTIENQPVVLSLKRKNYGPFYHDVIKKMPTDSNLWDFECILDTEKFKTDKGAVYYVMRFKPQLDNMLMMDQVIYDSLLAVKELVNSENSRIEDSYKQAHMGKAEDALMDNAAEVLGELETDFA